MIAFILKSLVPDFLVPKELIIQLVNNLSKYLVCPFSLFPDVFHVRKYGKIRPEYFFHWKVCLFFFQKIWCYEQPLRSKRNDLITSTRYVR